MKKTKIKIPIYDGELVIYKVKNWNKINKKFFKDDPLNESCSGVCTTYKHKYIVAFKGIPTNQIIVHEAKHLVNLIFRDRGILLDVNNDEYETYFLDWIFKQIENQF